MNLSERFPAPLTARHNARLSATNSRILFLSNKKINRYNAKEAAYMGSLFFVFML
jgi:hypothetical protein